MGKKIIIKESQFNKIISLLSEYMINNLNDLNVGDILTVTDINDDKHELTIESKVNGSVYGKDINGNSVIIKSIDMLKKEIKFIKNENNNQVEQVLKFKNIETSKNNDNINSDEDNDNINSDEDNDNIDSNEKNDDVLFNKYYNEILKNPNLQKAFYTAPSLWNYILAAAKGEKAKGKGLYPAYQIVNDFFSTRINDKLPGFTDKENKRATFYLLDTVIIRYRELNGKENELTMEPKHYKATVRQYEAGLGDVKVLSYRSSGGNFGFKLAVKKPTGFKQDEYYCDVYVNNNKVEENTYVQKNVRVKFINSDGYTSYDTLKKNK